MRRSAIAALLVLCTGLVGCSSSAKTGDVLAVFSNAAASGKTGRFDPAGAWDLEYTWDCHRARSEGLPGAQGLDLVVYNSDDDTTAFEHPEARSNASGGKGVLHFQRPGDYYVGMQTRCDWDVSIVNRSG
jgi:hypothetical protein